MEFYDARHSIYNVQLNGRFTPLDPDRLSKQLSEEGPSVDRYGFVGDHKQASESTLPVEVLREREVKWLEMLNNWDKWMMKKHSKVKERCRKGIPPSVRGVAWQHLSGSRIKLQQNPGVFEELAKTEIPEWEKVIEKDLSRTFPYHEMFCEKDGNGQRELFRILKAYAVYDSNTGYCQAMAPVAAVLLMHMTAEESFWCLATICDKYINGYYSPKLEAVKLDGAIFGGLLEKMVPHVAKHMEKHSVDPLMYMTEWFMCLLARNLPFATVLRVWDMFFFEGVKVLFRTTLTMLKISLTPKELLKCPGLFEINERLRQLPMDLMQEDVLIPASLDMKLSNKDYRKEHEQQLARQPRSPGNTT